MTTPEQLADLQALIFNLSPEHPIITRADAERAAAMLRTIPALSTQVEQLTRERDGLQAARMAYASEFQLNADGEPDVGNVHANIRALKAELAALREQAMQLVGAAVEMSGAPAFTTCCFDARVVAPGASLYIAPSPSSAEGA